MKSSINSLGIIELLFRVLNEYESSWRDTQRLLYRSFCLSNFSTNSITERFRNFKSTNDIEENLLKQFKLDEERSINWNNVLFSIIINNDNNNYSYIVFCYDKLKKTCNLIDIINGTLYTYQEEELNQ